MLLLPPSDATDTISHFLARVNDLFRHTLQNLSNSDMVVIMIQNRVNQNDKPIRISFKGMEQLVGDLIMSLVEKVSHSNARFNALVKLIMVVHSVRMPVGFCRAILSMCRPLSVMAQLKQVSWNSRQQKIVWLTQ